MVHTVSLNLLILYLNHRNLKDGIDLCKEVVAQKLPRGHITISFNPINWKQLALISEDRLSLWSVESCDTQMILTSV